ncbi:transcriptional crp fnr family [Nannochloropsis oceanica]
MGMMPIQESSSENLLSCGASTDEIQASASANQHRASSQPPPPAFAGILLGGGAGVTLGDKAVVIPADATLSRSKQTIREARRKMIGVAKISMHLSVPTKAGEEAAGEGASTDETSLPSGKPGGDGSGAISIDDSVGDSERVISPMSTPIHIGNCVVGQTIIPPSVTTTTGSTLVMKRQSMVGSIRESSLKENGPNPALSKPSQSSLPQSSAPKPPTQPPSALPARSTFARLAQMAVVANASDPDATKAPSSPTGPGRNSMAFSSTIMPMAAASARRKSSIAGAGPSPLGFSSAGKAPDVAAGNRRTSTTAAGARRTSLITPLPLPLQRASAIKQKFKVTDEVLRQIKTKNRATTQRSQAWSPRTWQRVDAKSSLSETESLVNSYVELVCEDLRTSEKRKMLAQDQEGGTWIIDPGALWRIRWDILILILIIWTSYSIPYRASFSTRSSGIEAWSELSIDIVFCLDVFLNFITAYYESEGILQTNPRAIARRYLRGWFFLDLVSSIPISELSSALSPTLARVFLALKFVKLLRLVRLMRYIDSKEMAMFFTPSMLRLFTTFVLLAWIWHVITCLYWYISISQGLGSSEWTPDADYHHNTDILNYFLCFLWTVQATFSIQTYSPPEKMAEAIFTIFCYLVGIFLNAYVIGSAGSALQSMDQDKNEQRQLMDRIITYMKKRQLPAYFQRIILDFYNYMSAKHSEQGILTDLPPAIQLRLSLLLNRELVKNIPLLKQLELNTIIGLMQTLQSTMYMPGEHVFKTGEKGQSLYFVKNGQLEITLDNVNVISNLQKGEMFGQVALTTDSNHDFNVRAAVYSEVLSLPREAYEDLSAESEKFMELVEMEAIKQEQFIVKAQKNMQRLAKMNRMGAGVGREGARNVEAGGGGVGGGGGRGKRAGNNGDGPNVRESIQKTKTISSVVGMFLKNGSSKVTPKR